jgi:hypothetical protein
MKNWASATRQQLSKDDVGYERPARGMDRCERCTHFEKPDQCELVRGIISPKAWCDRFAGKE